MHADPQAYLTTSLGWKGVDAKVGISAVDVEQRSSKVLRYKLLCAILKIYWTIFSMESKVRKDGEALGGNE